MFVDQVPAARKPYGNSDSGIKVIGGTNSELRIEANDDETLIQVVATSSNGTTVKVRDVNGFEGFSSTGSALEVSKLTIRTNDVHDINGVYPGGGTDVVVPQLNGNLHLLVDTGAGTYDQVLLGTTPLPGIDQDTVPDATIKTGAGNDFVKLASDSDDQTQALIDFGSGGLGLNNNLEISGSATATLGNLPGTNHRTYVDDVKVNAGGTFQTNHESTINHIHVDGFGNALIGAPATITTLELGNNVAAATIGAPSTIDTFNVNGVASFTGLSNPSTVTLFTNDLDDAEGSAGVVNVNADADITVLTSSVIGTLNIPTNGKLTLQERAGSPAPNSPGVRTLTVGHLNMGATVTGILDLKDNDLIVDYPDEDISPYHHPVAADQRLQRPRLDGSWH